MRKILLPVILIGVVLIGLLACGDDSSTTTQPESVEAAPTSVPTAEPTAVPTMEPTAVPEPTATAEPTPEPTPMPEPTATAEPTPEPTATAVPEPEPVSSMEAVPNLSDACLAGGAVDEAATVVDCTIQALLQVESFSFDGEIDLLALFPIDGAGGTEDGRLKLSGAIATPDRLKFSILMGPADESIEINGVMVGQDAYVQDPLSGQWLHGVPEDADFLASIQIVGMFQFPNEPNVTLGELVELEDGSKGYALVSEQAGPGGAAGPLPLPGAKMTWIVGAEDFLTRGVTIATTGGNGEVGNIIAITYGGYNEPVEIEPPANAIAIPEGMMDSGPTEAPMVVGLVKNGQGDVEVTFSQPVAVQGTVELYVLEPKTGGWGLPLLGGSGTNTLTFDADAEGKPTLVAGESQIAGFSFPNLEDRLAHADGGIGVNLNFDLWTYE